jgi:hypothetical protein
MTWLVGPFAERIMHAIGDREAIVVEQTMTPGTGWGPAALAGLAGMADRALVEKITPGKSGMVFFNEGSVSQAFFQI